MVNRLFHIVVFTICTMLFFTSITYAKPTVYILATGGTIAGAGTSSTQKTEYKAGSVLINTLLNALPEDIKDVANLQAEQVFKIGSQNMQPEYWLTLAKKVNAVVASKEVDAVVITHGTDTLEETALFLNLTVQTTKPIILVGAMRSSTSLSADGPKNLYDAIVVAANPQSANRGVLAVMNDTILSASDIMKSDTTAVQTFTGINTSAIGKVWGKNVFYLNTVEKRNYSTTAPFPITSIKTLPQVDILYGYAGATGKAVDSAVANGAQAIVYAGVGNGNFSDSVEKSLINASKKGVVIVRSSRVPYGATTQWTEVDDEKYGFIASWWNNPQRARIIVMLGLTKTKNKQELQKMMLEY